MPQSERFDAVIIGSGQAGNPLAVALAGAGRWTAMVESRDVGGTCVNTGCTPTKTMVASARVAYLARRAADYGVTTGPVAMDMDRVRRRKRDIVASFRGRGESRLQTENLELIRGEASFTGRKELRVALNGGGERRIAAEQIFIDSGTHAAKPDIPGLDAVPFLDNASIMELDSVPEHLLVLGGGYIGLEFGQMFRRFGSRVTILQSKEKLLPREDDDVCAEVLKIMEEDGVQVRLRAQTERAEADASGVRLTVNTGDKTETIEGSHLLVATGRTPNTAALNLSAGGVETDAHGFIVVNEALETTAPGIFALGDVKGGPQFTHISYDDYRIVSANLLHGERRTTRDRAVPYTVYIDPQLGRIGMTEAEARQAGLRLRVAKMPMTSVARALEVDETRGFMKAVVDGDTEQIVGAAVLGYEGGEVMSMLQIAMMSKLPFTALRDATFAHPTMAESLNNLFFRFES